MRFTKTQKVEFNNGMIFDIPERFIKKEFRKKEVNNKNEINLFDFMEREIEHHKKWVRGLKDVSIKSRLFPSA